MSALRAGSCTAVGPASPRSGLYPPQRDHTIIDHRPSCRWPSSEVQATYRLPPDRWTRGVRHLGRLELVLGLGRLEVEAELGDHLKGEIPTPSEELAPQLQLLLALAMLLCCGRLLCCRLAPHSGGTADRCPPGEGARDCLGDCTLPGEIVLSPPIGDSPPREMPREIVRLPSGPPPTSGAGVRDAGDVANVEGVSPPGNAPQLPGDTTDVADASRLKACWIEGVHTAPLGSGAAGSPLWQPPLGVSL